MIELVISAIVGLCPASGTVVESAVAGDIAAYVVISSCDDCASLAVLDATTGAVLVECVDTGDIVAVRE